MKASFLSNRIFWLNATFWLLFFSYKFYDFTSFMEPKEAFARIGVPMFFHLVLSYAHYFFILPGLLRNKRLIPYLTRLIPAIAVVMCVQVLTENQVLAPYARTDYFTGFSWSRFVSTLWDQMSFMIFTGMIKFVVDWFELENKKKHLENEKLNAELNYLKAQINPHFLFNTLHNLNYLALSKNDQASEVIVKLSNIMRYMIYEAGKSQVSVKAELDYIADYLDLEKIRLNRQADLHMDIHNVDGQLPIAPLVLIPFIENAFKHGMSDREGGWVKIKLSSAEDQLHLVVENSVLKKQSADPLNSGFGLKNIRQRLQLAYEGKHELMIEPDAEQFRVELKLDLS